MYSFTGSSRGRDRYRSSGALHALDNDELRQVAPSIFAENPMPGVSEAYAFLPTVQAIDAMRGAGWQPVWVSEQRVRLETREGFQKHMIRFQHLDHLATDSEYRPEVVLTNSHDRSSAYQLHAGLFRLVCGNGLLIADATFEKVSLRHSGFAPSQIVEASVKVLDSLPQLTDRVEGFRARRLTPHETLTFAQSAIELRYDDLNTAPVGVDTVLQPRRSEDVGNDLWNTLNRVQENLVRGGLKDRSRFNAEGKRYSRTRAIASLDQNVRLNKGLWTLAENLRAVTLAA